MRRSINVRSTLYRFRLVRANARRALQRWAGRQPDPYSVITPHSGTSLEFGKSEAIALIARSFPHKRCTVLDVGPGRGIYCELLKRRGYLKIDAVEIYEPYIKAFRLESRYRRIYHRDVVGFEYEPYDVVLFGDVLEHIAIPRARKVIEYARSHAKLVVVAVPYRLEQIGSQLDGSGDHRQGDLTRAVFFQRYPGFELLIDNHESGVFFSAPQEKQERATVPPGGVAR